VFFAVTKTAGISITDERLLRQTPTGPDDRRPQERGVKP
jgi:hypothetical protein